MSRCPCWASTVLNRRSDHVALEMGISDQAIRDGLKLASWPPLRIHGQCRRDQVIDDYGHHPVEIEAALSAARMLKPENKVIAVVQPHRYSRLQDLFADFVAVSTMQTPFLSLMSMPSEKRRLTALTKMVWWPG